LGDVVGELALGIIDMGTNDGGLILSSLEAMLALFAAFKEVADTGIELGAGVYVVAAELAGIEDRQELSIEGENRVRAEIGCGFEGLALKDGGAHHLESVVMLESKTNGLLEGDFVSRSLRR